MTTYITLTTILTYSDQLILAQTLYTLFVYAQQYPRIT